MFFICSHFRSYVAFGSIFAVLWVPLATFLGALADHLGPLAHHLSPLAHHLGPLGFPIGPLRAFLGALGPPSGRPLAALTLLYAHLGVPLPQWTPLGPPRAPFWNDFGSNFSRFKNIFGPISSILGDLRGPCFPIFVPDLFGSSLLRSHLPARRGGMRGAFE